MCIQSAAKIMEHDVITLDAEVFQHLYNSSIHDGRFALVVFTVFQRRILAESVIEKDFVGESSVAPGCLKVQ
jgi:hypothetical protein